MEELSFLGISMIFITMPAARQYTKQTNLILHMQAIYSLRKRYLIIISLSYLHGYMIRCDRHKPSQQT